MNCSKCGADNISQNIFCDSCGTKLLKSNKSKPAVPAAVFPAQPVAPVAPGKTVTLPAWLTMETILWAVIFVTAAFLLFFQLGEKPLHHDESLHAFYSWELFKGMGYAYNPMMHGPLLFHFNAVAYYLFGASDYTCRIVPALMGMLTIIMVYFLRPHLGKTAALITAMLITVSPSFTYFGRFIRNDIHIAAFTMIMVYGLFRYLDTRRAKFLYIGAIGLGLSFCTKEVTYITGSIFVTFLFFRWLWEYTTRPNGDNVLVTVLNDLWKDRKPLWISTLIVFGIVFVLYSTVFTHPQGFIDAFTKSLSYWLGQHEVQRGSQPVYFYAGLIPLYETLAFLGTIGALIYYSFIKNQGSRAWHALAYLILVSAWWLFAAHGNETFGLIFSLLLVALGVGMLAYFSFQTKDNFTTFLMLWTLAAFSDYSFAGERMPWLILHPLLPMMLLSGKLLGELWDQFKKQRVWIVVVLALFGSMMLHNTSLVNFYGKGANPAELLVYVQSSQDVPQVVKQLKNMSMRLKGNYEMKITCEDYCSWPFAWYLREFKNVGYPKYTASQPQGSIEENPVIITGVEMAAPGHDDRVAELLAEKYIAQRYKLRVWWAPDSRAFLNDTFGGKVKKAWRLFLYKEPWSGLGSYDMIIYIRKDVAHLYWGNAD
ncbi:TIGR03663 family protein [bacterium]|nr:TIGR03663 family protein [bacterium]